MRKRKKYHPTFLLWMKRKKKKRILMWMKHRNQNPNQWWKKRRNERYVPKEREKTERQENVNLMRKKRKRWLRKYLKKHRQWIWDCLPLQACCLDRLKWKKNPWKIRKKQQQQQKNLQKITKKKQHQIPTLKPVSVSDGRNDLDRPFHS